MRLTSFSGVLEDLEVTTSMPVSEARARLADLAQRLDALGRFL